MAWEICAAIQRQACLTAEVSLCKGKDHDDANPRNALSPLEENVDLEAIRNMSTGPRRRKCARGNRPG